MKYQLKQRFWSVGNNYAIRNEEGREVYKVDSQWLTLRKTLIFNDPEGNPVGSIVKKIIAWRPTYIIYRGDQEAARISFKKGWFKDRLEVSLSYGDSYIVKGDFTERNYTIRRGRQVVARVSKKWFLQLTDTYGVDVEFGEDDFVLLCTAIVIDLLASRLRNKIKKLARQTMSRQVKRKLKKVIP